MSQIIALGGDVSKGRIDVVFLNQSGSVLPGSGAYDDTRSGHEGLRRHLRALVAAHPDVEIRVGVEATGGYELNWLKLFRDERRRDKQVQCWRLNPLAIKKWLDADLHRSVTDEHAARGIAAYLLERRPQISEAEPTAHQGLYRLVRSARTDRGVLEQQLQLLLNQVHPELVCASRSGFPQWLLAVLAQYPTAAKVARAKPERLAAIPHVGADRAQALIAQARTSVASLTGSAAELTVGLLVERINHVDLTIKRCSDALTTALAGDPRVALLNSITGIGMWTATCLILEIGDITRFDSSRQLIAWAGLDAHDDLSGDGVVHRGISKRGNAYVRALLYMPTLSALSYNLVIKTFYQRLVARGKSHKLAIVAAMAKILRIAYSVLVTGTAFDPSYEVHRTERNQLARQNQPASEPPTAPVAPTPDLTAPVSRREASRRRAQARAKKAADPSAPQAGSKSQEATRVDREGSLRTDRGDTTSQAAARPDEGRHADATATIKTASGGPIQGPERCRPSAGRAAAGRNRRPDLVT